MAEKGWISVFALQNSAVDTAALQDLAVTNAKIADGTIQAAKLVASAARAGYYGMLDSIYGSCYYG